MSADINEVCRMLEDRAIPHGVSDSGHEVYWVDARGVRWSYFGRLYSGRESRLCAYGITPQMAVETVCGAEADGCAECRIGGA